METLAFRLRTVVSGRRPGSRLRLGHHSYRTARRPPSSGCLRSRSRRKPWRWTWDWRWCSSRLFLVPRGGEHRPRQPQRREYRDRPLPSLPPLAPYRAGSSSDPAALVVAALPFVLNREGPVAAYPVGGLSLARFAPNAPKPLRPAECAAEGLPVGRLPHIGRTSTAPRRHNLMTSSTIQRRCQAK